MADDSSSGASGILGVIVGALIVAALVFVLLGDRFGLRGTNPVNVKVEAPTAK